ncbi:Myc-type, basic helix-loop-helix (bHLH) domain [Dillenia turbinata]|uniref:Myc-type, basic helix-loop-helix (BHLH) domain n=1 Tax=Dillenia turbinata TaxID=194707 RepID=A0AAN8ZGS9_9MAGN
MEGESGQENIMHSTLMISGESNINIARIPTDFGNEDETANHLAVASLLQWTQCLQTSQDHLKYLAENSTYPYFFPTTDMLSGSCSSVNGIHNVHGFFDIQTEILADHSGVASTCGLADLAFHSNAWKVEPSVHVKSCNNVKSSVDSRRFLCPGQSITKGSENCRSQMSPASMMQELHEDNHESHQSHSRLRNAGSDSSSKSKRQNSLSREKAMTTDRSRRIRIAKRLEALRQVLPHSARGSCVDVVDDAIRRIKRLQFQIKELSRSRLREGSPSDPFAVLEGYGYYLHREKMMPDEQPEEMMDALLEASPSGVTKLLESRGLCILPKALAEGLLLADG